MSTQKPFEGNFRGFLRLQRQLSCNQLINYLFFRALYSEIVTLVKTLRYFIQVTEARIIVLKTAFMSQNLARIRVLKN